LKELCQGYLIEKAVFLDKAQRDLLAKVICSLSRFLIYGRSFSGLRSQTNFFNIALSVFGFFRFFAHPGPLRYANNSFQYSYPQLQDSVKCRG